MSAAVPSVAVAVVAGVVVVAGVLVVVVALVVAVVAAALVVVVVVAVVEVAYPWGMMTVVAKGTASLLRDTGTLLLLAATGRR